MQGSATIHNGVMKAIARVLFFSVALAVLLAMLLGLIGCGGEEGGSVDPQEILAAASAKMNQIKGFHFVYEVHKPGSAQQSTGLEIVRVNGDVNADGNMQATVDVVQAGIPLQLQFVLFGDTHYIQDPLSKKWQSLPAAESPMGTLNLRAGTIRILERIIDPEYVGREDKGGTTTFHIKGKIAAAEVEAIAGAVNSNNLFPTDLWIGVTDNLVYEVNIAGAATPNEDPKIWRSIVLSNLDTYTDIRPPQ